MDVASTYALSVAIYKLSIGIVNFVLQHQEKGPLITNISDIACQIQFIIAPLFFPNHVTYNSVKQILQVLQNALARTHHHLHAWEESRTLRFVAFVNPSAVTSELREDREQLVHQCLLLMVAMQVGDHMRQCQLLLPTAGDNTSTLPEYSEVVHSRRPSSSQPQNPGSILTPTFPLLIWIDDHLEGNQHHTSYASKHGVTVVRLGSTLAAKAWIRMNKGEFVICMTTPVCLFDFFSSGYLKQHDDPRNLRFISDQVRHEVNPDGMLYKNLYAGNEITRFIRGEGFNAPILICTTKRGIKLTRYVGSYRNTGSLTGSDHELLHEYLQSLGARRKGDTGWMKFGG